MKTVYLFLLLCGASPFALASLHETPVVIKPNIRDYENSFTTNATTFSELIRKNKIFVDNTLFIKEYRDTVGPFYIMGPMKSGKSVNLDMLKTFLEIQVDDQGNRILPKNTTANYKLFVNGEIPMEDGTTVKLTKPFVISEHKDVVKNHLGEYPVVYVTFKDVRGNNAKDILLSLGLAVRQAFVRHKYMMNVLRKTAKNPEITATKREMAETYVEMFEKILNEEVPKTISLLGEYVQSLCQILSEHFDQKSVIIFDDYDRPLTNILNLPSFTENDLAEAREIMDTFTIWAFRTNDQISEAYLTVEFELKQLGRGSWMNYMRTDVLIDYTEPFARYFVWNENTVQYLFDMYKFSTETRNRANEWYKGFQSNRFNVHSIANFLNTGKFATYFQDRDFERLVKSLIETNISIRNIIISLFNKLNIVASYDGSKTPIAELELFKLKPQIFDVSAPYDQLSLSMFKLFLIRKGYLSVHQLHEHDDGPVNYSELRIEFGIPNNEIAASMSLWMISYYQREYNIPDQQLQNAALSLLHFVDNQTSAIPQLEAYLADLYNRSSPFLGHANHNRTDIEDPFHAVFTCVTLRMQYLSDFHIYVSYPKFTKRPTLARTTIPYGPFPKLKYLFINNHTSQAVVLRLTYNQRVENTLKSLKQHESGILKQLNYLNRVRVVAVMIRPDNTVQVYARLSTDE